MNEANRNNNVPISQVISNIKASSQKKVKTYDNAIASYKAISNPLSSIKTPDDFGDRLSKFVFGGPFQLSYNSPILINLSDLSASAKEKFDKALSDYKSKCANSHSYNFNIVDNGKGEYLLPYHAVIGLANECVADKSKIDDNCNVLSTLSKGVRQTTADNSRKTKIYQWTTLGVTLVSGTFTTLLATGVISAPAVALYVSLTFTALSLGTTAVVTIVRVVRTMMEEKDADRIEELIDQATKVNKELEEEKINCVAPVVISQQKKEPDKKKEANENKKENNDKKQEAMHPETQKTKNSQKKHKKVKKNSNDLQDKFNKKQPKPLNNGDNLLGTQQANKKTQEQPQFNP